MKSVLCAFLMIGSIGQAVADDIKRLTAEPILSIGKCLEILSGLNLFDHFDDYPSGKPKQYRFGAAARLTIALNIGALRPIADAAEKVRLGMVADLNDRGAGRTEQMKVTAEYQESLKAPCNVTLGHIKVTDLRVGDGPDENQFPPSAIASIMAIMDR